MTTTSPSRRTWEAATAAFAAAIWGALVSQARRHNEELPVVVRNATTSRISIQGQTEPGGSEPTDRLILAPFESMALTPEMWKAWEHPLRRLCGRRKVEILRPTRKSMADRLPTISTAVLVCATIGLLIAGAAFRSPTAWLAIGAAFGFLALARVVMSDRVHLSFLAALAASLLISAALPALAIYYSAGVDEVIAALRNGPPGPDPLVLVGRIAQWSFIWIAAFLPAGLYFLFDRVRLASLRERFERDILRFDPTVETVPDVRARYGAAMSEAFTTDLALGRDDRAYETEVHETHLATHSDEPPPPGRARACHRHGRAFYRQVPVVLATVVIALGWTLALLNPHAPILERGGSGEYVLGLLQPHASPIVFAFLGAYTFTLQSLFRSYVRSDLRPKSYTHAAVRIVVAMVFAWVLALIFLEPTTDLTVGGNGGLLAVAFIVGFVPETLLVRLQELARAFCRGRHPMSWLYERHPLTRLVGIDIYDRARLLEEGVGNIEGLAHHDLPELMLKTRIPVGRIVNWADQAILYIHVVSPDEETEAREPSDPTDSPSPRDPERPAQSERRLRLLRGYGISSATALIRAQSELTGHARQRLMRLLDDDQESARPQRRLEILLAAIKDEQWIPYLQAWHSPHHSKLRSEVVDWDGESVGSRARRASRR